jgi:cysteine desulfurase
MKKPVYMDYAATTPVDPRVIEKMVAQLKNNFGNAEAHTHSYGKEAKAAIDEARKHVANLLNAEPTEIIWTSGATEGINLALKGAAQLYQRKGKHIITWQTEHKAVLATCEQLEKSGFDVSYLKPSANGQVDEEEFLNALRPDTILVCLMHLNNETGIIQNIASIAEFTAARDILFHVDAAQSQGKLPIDVNIIAADLITLSAHKIYGPKGVGALYARRKPRVRVAAQIHGGGHEQGMRSGTLPTHQIVGMGEACKIAKAEMQADEKKLHKLRARFLEKISSIENYLVNDFGSRCYPGILNLQFPTIKSDKLLAALPDVAFAAGSACNSKGVEPSYVLRALGLTMSAAASSVRFSFGRFTTEEEIDYVAGALVGAVPVE